MNKRIKKKHAKYGVIHATQRLSRMAVKRVRRAFAALVLGQHLNLKDAFNTAVLQLRMPESYLASHINNLAWDGNDITFTFLVDANMQRLYAELVTLEH